MRSAVSSPFMIVLCAAHLWALGAPQLPAATIHVNWDGSGDYPTIQEGIDAATYGDTVLVAPGTYYEQLHMGAAADGIVLLGEAGPDSTVVDCEDVFGSRGLSCEHVGDDTAIAGLTFTRCYLPSGPGAGIRCVSASPTITDCAIIDCFTGGDGGGIYAYFSTPVISDVEIRDCQGRDGGGIWVGAGSAVIQDCVITDNRAQGFGGSQSGGGLYLRAPCTVSRCIVSDNYALYGGGISVDGAWDIVVEGTSILSNVAGYYGGAFKILNASVTVSGCVIAWNHAHEDGGAASIANIAGPQVPEDASVFTDNVFFQNTADEGDAILVRIDAPVPIFNSNYFVNSTTYEVRVADTASPETLDFTGNWWGTDDPDAIAERIYDSADDPSVLWSIDFSDWCTNPSCLGQVTGVEGDHELRKSWSTIKNLYR